MTVISVTYKEYELWNLEIPKLYATKTKEPSLMFLKYTTYTAYPLG
jgi:hypothetical protein